MLIRKISTEEEQTLAELTSAYRRSQAKCQLVQTSYIKRINTLCQGGKRPGGETGSPLLGKSHNRTERDSPSQAFWIS